MRSTSRRLCWLLGEGFEQRDGQLTSIWASARYRALPAIRGMVKDGHAVEALIQSQIADVDALKQVWKPCDALIISKVYYDRVMPIVHFVQAQGTTIIGDFCDDHFDTPRYQEGFHALLHAVDYVVCSTQAMSECIRQRAGRCATVINDPFEAPEAPPAFHGTDDRVRLLWFGHATNIATIDALLPRLVEFGQRVPLSLEIVTNTDEVDVAGVCERMNGKFGHALKMTCSNWSLATQWEPFSRCDLVVIPSMGDSRWQVKSPNRAVESLRCGRFVVSNPIPSYAPLTPFTWQGENIVEGIEWAIAHPRHVLARIREGQEFVAREFVPARIVEQWKNCIDAAVDGRLRLVE